MEKLIIKNSWKEVSIADWIEIGKVEEKPELNGLNITKRIKIGAILSNKTEQEISNFSGENFGRIAEAVAFVEKEPPKKRKKKGDALRIIKVKGGEYIFHPKPQELNAGEMASIEQLLVEQKNGGEIATAGILAILVRPFERVENKEFNRVDFVIDPFDSNNFQERKELFLNHLMVDEIWHEWAFFFDLGKQHASNTQPFTGNRKSRRARK